MRNTRPRWLRARYNVLICTGGAQFESGREYTDQIGIRSTCREARRKVYWIMRPNIDMISSSQAAPSKLLDASLLKQLHPHMKGRFEFWADPDVAKRSGLQIGDDAIFKTKGDSLLLAELRAVHGFSGDGGEVMNQISRLSDKHLEAPQVLAQDLMEGVADEEWDD